MAGVIIALILSDGWFSQTITLGSVIVAVVGLAGATFYTIRSKVVETWKSEYEGQLTKAQRLTGELTEAKEERLRFELEQQEIRHALKDELAAVRIELEVERTKHDFTGVLEGVRSIHEELERRADLLTRMFTALSGISEQQERITQSQEKLLALLEEKTNGHSTA